MKKMIISVFVCLVLVFGAIVAWCYYLDILAAALFVAAVVPSCFFEEGRQELKAQDNA